MNPAAHPALLLGCSYPFSWCLDWFFWVHVWRSASAYLPALSLTLPVDTTHAYLIGFREAFQEPNLVLGRGNLQFFMNILSNLTSLF